MVAGRSSSPQTESPLRSKPRILVVDDEETVVVTVSGVLELDGYDVSPPRPSAGAALELLRGQMRSTSS